MMMIFVFKWEKNFQTCFFVVSWKKFFFLIFSLLYLALYRTIYIYTSFFVVVKKVLLSIKNFFFVLLFFFIIVLFYFILKTKQFLFRLELIRVVVVGWGRGEVLNNNNINRVRRIWQQKRKLKNKWMIKLCFGRFQNFLDYKKKF